MSCFLGIDPGVKAGGFGLIDADGNLIECGGFNKFLTLGDLSIKSAGLERIQFQHRDKGAKLFHIEKLLINFGEWRGILKDRGIDFIEIQPLTWQSGFGLVFRRGAGKAVSLGQLKLIKSDMVLKVAQMLFPNAPLNRRKDDGIAAGLLIAEYVRRIGKQAELFEGTCQ